MGKYLVTGITGSLGQAVSTELLKQGHSVVGYSRDELKQSQLPRDEKLTLYLGDVRDQRRLVEASRDVDTVFHFAALKRVDSMEANPEECIQTNIEGTINVLGAQRANDIQRVVLSSTDKAAHPETVYGACKLISERLVLRNPNNVVCRYGNVLASRGSVIPEFVRTIQNGGYVSITHPDMTRFFIRLEDAARFVVSEGLIGKGGLKIPELKACKILDLAWAVARAMGAKDPQVKVIGMRGIEKLHEALTMPCDGKVLHSNTAPQFNANQLLELVSPIVSKIIGRKAKKVLVKRPVEAML